MRSLLLHDFCHRRSSSRWLLAPGQLTQAERALFQKQKWGWSPVLSGMHRLSSVNSLIFSVSSLFISFTFLLYCKPLGSSMYKLFFFHLPGNIGHVSKIKCETGLLLTSLPGPSLFLLPKVPWLWISNHVSIPPIRASSMAQQVKNLPAMQETQVQTLGQGEPLGKEIATDSSILAWKIPWTEEPRGLQSKGLQRVDTAEQLHMHTNPSYLFLLQSSTRSTRF